MSDELAAPVRALINAFNRGSVLVRRICRAAPNGPSYLLLDTLEQAQNLERSVAKSGLQVMEACFTGMKTFGAPFTEAITNDR
jgi:hypothetical protein